MRRVPVLAVVDQRHAIVELAEVGEPGGWKGGWGGGAGWSRVGDGAWCGTQLDSKRRGHGHGAAGWHTWRWLAEAWVRTGTHLWAHTSNLAQSQLVFVCVGRWIAPNCVSYVATGEASAQGNSTW